MSEHGIESTMKDDIGLLVLREEIERRRHALIVGKATLTRQAKDMKDALDRACAEPENPNHYAHFRLSLDVLAYTLDSCQTWAREIADLSRAVDVLREAEEGASADT